MLDNRRPGFDYAWSLSLNRLESKMIVAAYNLIWFVGVVGKR